MFDSDVCKKKDGSPLKSYESEEEADEAILYVKARYGNEQVKYLCEKCGFWHLSPPERQTKSRASFCLDSNGKSKKAYETFDAAMRRANIIFKERGERLFVYECPDCGLWHLTHKNPNGCI